MANSVKNSLIMRKIKNDVIIKVIRWIEEGGRLAKPDRCPEKVYIIMRQCWEYEPRSRPTFRDLLQIFRREPDFFEFNES